MVATRAATDREEALVESTTNIRPTKGWRADHLAWDRIDRSYKGRWEYEPGCECAKCENFWNSLAACVGDFPI